MGDVMNLSAAQGTNATGGIPHDGPEASPYKLLETKSASSLESLVRTTTQDINLIYFSGHAATSPPSLTDFLQLKGTEKISRKVILLDATLASHVEQSKAAAVNPVTSLAPDLAPVRALAALQDYWGASDTQMKAMCGLPPEGDDPFSSTLVEYFALPDIKLRMRTLMRIRSRLSALFQGNRDSERSWIRAPWPLLNNSSPVDAMVKADLPTLIRIESSVGELAGA